MSEKMNPINATKQGQLQGLDGQWHDVKVFDVMDTLTPQQKLDFAARNLVREAIDDLDLSCLDLLYSRLVGDSPDRKKALAESVSAYDLSEFKSYLQGKFSGEFMPEVEQFWDELTKIATEAVDTGWSHLEARVFILSPCEQTDLRKELNWLARDEAIRLVNDNAD